MNSSRSKVIVVCVIVIYSRKVVNSDVTWCDSRRKGYCKSLFNYNTYPKGVLRKAVIIEQIIRNQAKLSDKFN